MNSAIILSGGMDSTALLHYKKSEIGLAITFDYKSKHNDQEYKMAKINTDKLGIEHLRIELHGLAEHLRSDLLKSGGQIPEGHYAHSNMKRTVVPFRNGIMLSIAAGIAESHGLKNLLIGNHAGDHAIYPDCRLVFINRMREAIKRGTYDELNLESPFVNLSKAGIIKLANSTGIDWAETYSCYNGDDIHCGRCSTCFERREAFHLAGVKDPTQYKDQTPIELLIKEYEARQK